MEVETAWVTSALLTSLEVTKMAKLAGQQTPGMYVYINTHTPEYLEKKYHPASNLL